MRKHFPLSRSKWCGSDYNTAVLGRRETYFHLFLLRELRKFLKNFDRVKFYLYYEVKQ